MADALVDRLAGLCRDVARQAQAAGPQHLEDLTAGDRVVFFGHPMVVVTADPAVVELIAPDPSETP